MRGAIERTVKERRLAQELYRGRIFAIGTDQVNIRRLRVCRSGEFQWPVSGTERNHSSVTAKTALATYRCAGWFVSAPSDFVRSVLVKR
jgi:hypothetical protein